MKNLITLSLLMLFKINIYAQTTDIRPTNINYPVLNTAAVLALTPGADGLRQGTTVYNSDLKTLVIFDGCEWAVIDKNYNTDQNIHQELVAPVPQNGANFGSSHEILGKILVVGAMGMDVGGSVDQGEAYIYRKNGCFWQYFATLPDPSGLSGNNFGKSIDIKFSASDPTKLLVAVAGNQSIRTYLVSLDINGNPFSIMSDQLIPNTSPSPFLYVKIGQQALDDELVITYGSKFIMNYFSYSMTGSGYSNCTYTNSNNNKISILKRNSGAYVPIFSTPTDYIFSQGVTIPGFVNERKIYYAQNTCEYWGYSSSSGTGNLLNRIDYTTSSYLIPSITQPQAPVIPFLDLDVHKNYSTLAIGEQYGRNKKIKILTISRNGEIDAEENITESNVFVCVGVTPTSCYNGIIPYADFYGETLSISDNKLIVSAKQTDWTSGTPNSAKGAIYLYKKKGVWGLEKIISGQNNEGIGSFVSSTSESYVYSSIRFNSNQGKVFIGEW